MDDERAELLDLRFELIAKGVQEVRERLDALEQKADNPLYAISADPPTTLTPGVVDLIAAARGAWGFGGLARLHLAIDALDGEEWETREVT